jgi:hypothetical protein
LRAAAAVLVFAGLIADGWVDAIPLAAPIAAFPMPDARDAIVLELPVEESRVGTTAMFRMMQHGRPIVNGYSGHTPPHFGLLSHGLQRGDPTLLTSFARGRSLVVIVHRAHDPAGEWRALVQQAGGVLQEESGVGPVYVIPPQPRERIPPVGPPVAGRPVENEAGYAAIDLGSEQIVRGITVTLRWRYAEIGRRMTVETSNDGTTWTPVWQDWTGAAALAGALEDPLLVPMRVYFPDVRARYIRVTPAAPWVAHQITASPPGAEHP